MQTDMVSWTFAKWSYKIRHFNFICAIVWNQAKIKKKNEKKNHARDSPRVCTRFCCIGCCFCYMSVVGWLTYWTYASEQSHLLRITLGKVPITNCSEYSNDGWILKGVDSHDEHVPIETRKDKITSAQCAHGTHQCLLKVESHVVVRLWVENFVWVFTISTSSIFVVSMRSDQ